MGGSVGLRRSRRGDSVPDRRSDTRESYTNAIGQDLDLPSLDRYRW